MEAHPSGPDCWRSGIGGRRKSTYLAMALLEETHPPTWPCWRTRTHPPGPAGPPCPAGGGAPTLHCRRRRRTHLALAAGGRAPTCPCRRRKSSHLPLPEEAHPPGPAEEAHPLPLLAKEHTPGPAGGGTPICACWRKSIHLPLPEEAHPCPC
ncbi:uncharacterized protein LOC123257081 [Drosophila ananassae]|nr:uncharacterized protein LOC123257081 [Drosophila ananassae]